MIGCDKSALAMAALAALSGAISHQMRLRMNRHDDSFVVSPCLWVLMIGDPGAQKTPIVNAVTDPLAKLQKEEMRAYSDDLRRWEESDDDGKGPKPVEPPGHLIFDTTVEALCIKLALTNDGILTVADELSAWLGQMEKYSGSSASRGLWLKARNGGHYQVNRVGRKTDFVENLSSSLLGGIQPDRLAEITGLSSDGLLQRFLPVMINQGALGKDMPTGPSAADYERLVLACVNAPAATLTMTDAALERMWALREHFHALTNAAAAISPGFQSFVNKLPGVAGNLAVILHVARNPARCSDQVDDETIAAVEKIIKEFVLPHGEAFYEGDANAGIERMRKIASYVLTSGKTTFMPSDFTRNVAPLRGFDLFELKRAVSPLVAGGWLDLNDRWANAPRWTLCAGVADQMENRRREREMEKCALAALMGAKRRPS